MSTQYIDPRKDFESWVHERFSRPGLPTQVLNKSNQPQNIKGSTMSTTTDEAKNFIVKKIKDGQADQNRDGMSFARCFRMTFDVAEEKPDTFAAAMEDAQERAKKNAGSTYAVYQLASIVESRVNVKTTDVATSKRKRA